MRGRSHSFRNNGHGCSGHILATPPTKSTWAAFTEITSKDRQIRANLVPDAWLAALALSHGCRIATTDRGFGRFNRLEWFDPITPT
ncbi:MAG: PIN domain-containing protein [Acidimicrobiia bacterium]|nr:PIN domain-containing protein [Acidimicrobiia bacterium]